jgi:hypothetical protein
MKRSIGSTLVQGAMTILICGLETVGLPGYLVEEIAYMAPGIEMRDGDLDGDGVDNSVGNGLLTSVSRVAHSSCGK